MPLWNIYHPIGAYSAQDKREFAEKSPRCIQGFRSRNFTS